MVFVDWGAYIENYSGKAESRRARLKTSFRSYFKEQSGYLDLEVRILNSKSLTWSRRYVLIGLDAPAFGQSRAM